MNTQKSDVAIRRGPGMNKKMLVSLQNRGVEREQIVEVSRAEFFEQVGNKDVHPYPQMTNGKMNDHSVWENRQHLIVGVTYHSSELSFLKPRYWVIDRTAQTKD